ncbi:MAG TPA: Fe-S cluster assembly protein SufD [Enteractinococcus helveticum]|uniref:Fe-S cluster assembly protein SufD n=1 Tax=Enteractinococcus helveticum TaxID=1837282 RepID=A0A921FKB2_9MICC|nr:Fe-S cluster assembly protein SufD [Enteractinococcus helveticum]HJF13648.1 Fe-S cluster assembly protein SufD [Enteractinococcus helveticum]
MANTDATTLDDGPALLIPGMGEEGETLVVKQATGQQSDSDEVKFGTSRADRPTSYNLADFPVLTGEEEDWRFTPLHRLAGLHLPDGDDALLTGAAPKVTVTEVDGVTIETVGRDDKRLGSFMIPDDRTSAAAWASFSQATVITVADNLEIDTPITVSVEGNSMDPAAQHIYVAVGANTHVNLVINQTGKAIVSQNIEFAIGEGANVNVTSVQAWDDETVHIGSQQASLGKDSTFKHVVITYGGSLVRLTPITRFAGEGATTNMYGLYFADAGQHLEHRIFIDHSTDNCTSDALYKGALQGQGARTVWVGDVLIQGNTSGTDSYEKNENLLLTEGAQADSIPNLEIETGIIDSGGHASSVGRFDEQQLFYLMARGIPEPVARKLIVRGFLNEIIQKIGIEEVEKAVTEVMEEEIAGLEL